MNQKEFIAKDKELTVALKARCKAEGISFRVHQERNNLEGHQIIYVLADEVYTVTNNGDVAHWQFSGFMRG